MVGQPGELTPVLVEPDLWRNANEHLSANRGSRTRNAQAPMLLRNRVYWEVCGGLLHAEHSTRPGRRSYYRCKASHPEQYRTPNVQGRTPASLAVAQADLDDWVWSTVRATLVDRREVVTEIRRRLEGQRDAPVRSEAAQLEERVAKLERQRAALLRLFTEAEGAMPWATIAPELARLESEHAEALVLLDATRERLGKSAADLARLDGLDTVARRLGPMLVDPDLDTRVQVVAELGLTVRATRLHQTLEWTLPLASGEQSGWAALIDLSHVEEPDEATRAALLAEDLAEVFRDDPDEGTSGRGGGQALGIACGQPTIPVDIHVHRVANRWDYVRTKTPEQTLAILEEILPVTYRPSINRLVLPFGKYICTGPAPKCPCCPLNEICPKMGVTTVSKTPLPRVWALPRR